MSRRTPNDQRSIVKNPTSKEYAHDAHNRISQGQQPPARPPVNPLPPPTPTDATDDPTTTNGVR